MGEIVPTRVYCETCKTEVKQILSELAGHAEHKMRLEGLIAEKNRD